MYSIDWNKILKHLVRVSKLMPFRKVWLRLLLSQIELLHVSFLSFTDEKRYIAQFSFSKIYMEKLLNDQFDPVNTSITIQNNAIVPPMYLFQEAENLPVHIYQESENLPVHIYQTQEYSGQGFQILVPAAVTFDAEKMKARINIYCYYGIDYTIKII